MKIKTSKIEGEVAFRAEAVFRTEKLARISAKKKFTLILRITTDKVFLRFTVRICRAQLKI